MLAFLLNPVPTAKEDIYHAVDFFYAGIFCAIVALGYAAVTFALRGRKKSRSFSYGFWLILSSGIAMIGLAFLLNALNPTVEVRMLN
jgi:hypothetical protein